MTVFPSQWPEEVSEKLSLPFALGTQDTAPASTVRLKVGRLKRKEPTRTP